uniref:DUF7217 domain-containing protein n=1 Tax=Salmonella phage vB_STmST313_KE27 TaxID=3161178 RepID=A0AAU8GK39_9CAUD
MNAQIYDVLSSGNAFSNPLPSLSGPSQDLITSGSTNIPLITANATPEMQVAMSAGGLTPDKLTAAATMYSTANTGITTLNTYGDQSINDAYSRIGTSVSYKSGLKSISREPNNCDLINKAFGVVQDLGHQWLNAMEGALQTVTNKISELYEMIMEGASEGMAKLQELAAEVTGHINTAITAVNGVISDITDGIAAELAHIESMIKECLNFSFANVLAEWAKDLCAGGVIDKIGTPALKESLK